jgi:hypothetical protein
MAEANTRVTEQQLMELYIRVMMREAPGFSSEKKRSYPGCFSAGTGFCLRCCQIL